MFEKALRMKLRFAHKGQITTEDLWDLSVTTLDSIYKGLRAAQKEQEGDSLLAEKREDSTLALQIDIVKHIVTVKQAETDAKKARALKAEQKQRIMEILAQKQDAALLGKSEDELKTLLAQM